MFQITNIEWTCIILSSAFFGLFHLVNLFGTTYQKPYVFLQVIIGFLMGVFYSCSFVFSGSLWVPIGYHVLNNFASSFMPPKLLQISAAAGYHYWWTDPIILLPLFQTVATYSFLLWLLTRTYKGRLFK